MEMESDKDVIESESQISLEKLLYLDPCVGKTKFRTSISIYAMDRVDGVKKFRQFPDAKTA